MYLAQRNFLHIIPIAKLFCVFTQFFLLSCISALCSLHTHIQKTQTQTIVRCYYICFQLCMRRMVKMCLKTKCNSIFDRETAKQRSFNYYVTYLRMSHIGKQLDAHCACASTCVEKQNLIACTDAMGMMINNPFASPIFVQI